MCINESGEAGGFMRAYRPELEQSTAVGLDAVLDEPERCEIVYGAQQFERRV